MKTPFVEPRATFFAVSALVVGLLLIAPAPTISATASEALRPGTSSALDLVFANPHPYAITVTSVTTVLSGVTDARTGRPSRCAPSNFSIANPIQHVHFVLPAYGRASYSSLHVARWRWPRVRMTNSGTSQDDCRRIALKLVYRSTGLPGSEP